MLHPLEYAMQVELQGKEFYLEQASLMEDSGFREVFEGLAADEEKHYQLLKQIKDSDLYETPEGTTVDERAANIFSGPVRSDSYITIYQQAIDFEEKAIDLYSELAREAASEREREAFLFLEREEEGHRALLQRILEWLQRPEEWHPHI